MKKRSKPAFEHNVKAEIHAGKPKDQALAIAYSVKRRAKKAQGGKLSTDPKDYTKDMQAEAKDKIDQQQKIDGYAEGGKLSRDERKSMAARAYGEKFRNSLGPNPGGKSIGPVKDMDRHHHYGINHQDPRKPEGQSHMGTKVREPAQYMTTAKEDAANRVESMKMASKPKLQGLAEGGRVKTTKIKHPRMVASDVLQARLRDEEDDMMDSMPPSSPKDQPPMADDEMGADRHGPESVDLHMKKMAYGGKAEDDGVEHPAGLEEDDDQMKPSDDEIMADHFAEGGRADANDYNEEEIEHAASLAAAIMMKRKKMAMGGEASMETTDDDQANLSRNADEDMNLEDQASFDAMRKENYSESEGLEQMDSPMDSAQHGHEDEDVHDKSVVGQIRSKMKKKSAMTR